MEIIQKLEGLRKQEDNKLTLHVIDYILEMASGDEDLAEATIQDILQYGCQSGVVSHLVYYTDTYKFFDEFYEEIEELRLELEDSYGEPLEIKGDLKNSLAWLGFEETLYKIAQKIGM